MGLYGFSRIPFDPRFATDVHANYATEILPFIILMSLGMGATFVPVTLTAVHHLRPEDSGIGSGVLNTMQQVGGALGLATLSTVAAHVISNWADTAQAQSAGGVAPSPDMLAIAEQQIFANGATSAFLVGSLGSVMALLASAVVWVFLNVKHEELATDGPEGPVHVG